MNLGPNTRRKRKRNSGGYFFRKTYPPDKPEVIWRVKLYCCMNELKSMVELLPDIIVDV